MTDDEIKEALLDREAKEATDESQTFVGIDFPLPNGVVAHTERFKITFNVTLSSPSGTYHVSSSVQARLGEKPTARMSLVDAVGNVIDSQRSEGLAVAGDMLVAITEQFLTATTGEKTDLAGT